MRHYFLFTSLPPLDLKAKPDVSADALRQSFKLNLSEDELTTVSVIREYQDIENLFSLITDGRERDRGNFSKKELKEILETKDGLPEYFIDFFETYEGFEEQKQYFPKLFVDFFKRYQDHKQPFIRDFVRFERDLRLILLAFRAKKIHADLIRELQFEDLGDPLVMDILAKKDSPHYEFPFEYRGLKDALERVGPNPLKQEFAIVKYRFIHYGKYIEEDPFTMDALLAYFVRHDALDGYYSMSGELGEQFIDGILEKKDARER